MPWTTIEARTEKLDEEVASFEATVTSIDAFSIASHGHGQAVALVEYTS